MTRTGDENVDVTRCAGKADCQNGERCLTHELWNDLSNRLYEFLDDISLDQFIDRPEIREIARRQDEEVQRMNFVFPRPAA
jgi:Rrf2 family iron-sulfur cluster assembly transcriptional regulator